MTSSIKTQTQNKNQPINQMSTKKKIGFLSAIMFVIGSSIGAGIFLKNDEVMTNTHYSIVFSIIAWLFAFIGIFAMALALIEIVSSSKIDNREGIVGWVKTFNNKYLYLGCRNFMAYVYTPINAFAMPYYAVQQFCDGIGWDVEWYVIVLISFAIMIYFLITTALSSKLTNLQNWITLIIKFIPLAIAAFLGFIFLGLHPGQIGGNGWLPKSNPTVPLNKDNTYMNNLYPVLGIFMSIPSVLFVVDGFYSSTAIQSSMKEPKKMNKAILLGLISILSIDILIAISLMFGPKEGGGITGFSGWLPDWFYKAIQILISIGILGVINGICAYTAKMYEQMVDDKTIVFNKFVNKICGNNKQNATLFYVLTINIFAFILATTIGRFFINTSIYTQYTPTMSKLYSFVDLTANWTALFAFLIINIAIVGGLVNRKTNKVSVVKNKYFVPSAMITISIIFISIVMEITKSIGNLYLAIDWFNFFDKSIATGRLVGSILMLLTMIIFVSVLFYPCLPIYKRKLNNKPLAK